jgi:hypothetical protein
MEIDSSFIGGRCCKLNITIVKWSKATIVVLRCFMFYFENVPNLNEHYLSAMKQGNVLNTSSIEMVTKLQN